MSTDIEVKTSKLNLGGITDGANTNDTDNPGIISPRRAAAISNLATIAEDQEGFSSPEPATSALLPEADMMAFFNNKVPSASTFMAMLASQSEEPAPTGSGSINRRHGMRLARVDLSDAVKKDTLRYSAIIELVTTEREYVKDLQFIIENYEVPLRTKLTSPDMSSIFSNLDEILHFHQQLCMELVEVPVENLKLGQIIFRNVSRLKMYTTYCSSQSASLEAVTRLADSKEFQQVLAEAIKQPQAKRQSIGAFLIKPVQRIMKYPLMLKKMIEYTPVENEDIIDLQNALTHVEAMLEHINTEKRKHDKVQENIQKLKDVQAEVEGSEVLRLSDDPFRKFIVQGEWTRVDSGTSTPYRYYIFSDMLITSRPTILKKDNQLHSVFSYSKSLVRDADTTEVVANAVEILKMDRNEKIYKFVFSNYESKAFFLKYFRDANYLQTLNWDSERSAKYRWFLEQKTGDNDRMTDLVLCYRGFSTPLAFLNMFQSKFRNLDLYAIEILRTFIEGLSTEDFIDPPADSSPDKEVSAAAAPTSGTDLSKLLDELLDSVNNPSAKGSLHAMLAKAKHTEEVEEAQKIETTRLQRLPSGTTTPGSSLAVAMDLTKKPDVVTLKEVAEGVTLSEFRILQRVRENELLNTNWNRTNGKDLSPNVVAVIDKFNWTSHWISSKILKRDSPQKRAELIAAFIEMGMHFRELHNFNGVMEVLSSLHSTPIDRLRDSWALISEPIRADFVSLSELMKTDKNFANYREALAAVEPGTPCLPCLGCLLTDLTFIEEANPKFVNGNINPNYLMLMGSKLREFNSYQKREYSMINPKAIHAVSYSEVVFEEEELYKLSKLREDFSAPASEYASPPPLTRVQSYSTISRRKRHTISAAESLPTVQSYLGVRDWQVLLADSSQVKFAAGDVLFQEQDLCAVMYKIEKGTAAISIKQQKLYEVSEGETVGEIYFLSSAESSWFTAVAETDMVASTVEKDFVLRLFENEPDLAARFYKHLANRLNTTLREAMAVFAREKSLITRRPSFALVDNETPMDNNDKLFANIFKLKQEIVVKMYPAKVGMMTGLLFVTKNFLCYYAKAFGFNKKKIIPFATVEEIKATKNTIEVKQQNKAHPKKYEIKKDMFQDCEAIVISLWEASLSPVNNAQQFPPSRPVSMMLSKASLYSEQNLASILSEDDWKLIMKGTKCLTYKPGTSFVLEGVRPKSLFHIVKGICLIQKNVGGNAFTVAKRQKGDIFGEMSFLDESYVASASVVAETEVEAYVLDFNFVHILLSVYKDLAPKFYKYLAHLIEKRFLEFLHQFSKAMLEKETKKEKNSNERQSSV